MFQICPVCFWEDDGQDDHDAEAIRGGPNYELSLSQARRNFAKFGPPLNESSTTFGHPTTRNTRSSRSRPAARVRPDWCGTASSRSAVRVSARQPAR
jgi:hypothetical protein